MDNLGPIIGSALFQLEDELCTSPCCQFSAPRIWPPSNSNLYLEDGQLNIEHICIYSHKGDLKKAIPAVDDSDTPDFVVVAPFQHLRHCVRRDRPVRCFHPQYFSRIKPTCAGCETQMEGSRVASRQEARQGCPP